MTVQPVKGNFPLQAAFAYKPFEPECIFFADDAKQNQQAAKYHKK